MLAMRGSGGIYGRTCGLREFAAVAQLNFASRQRHLLRLLAQKLQNLWQERQIRLPQAETATSML